MAKGVGKRTDGYSARQAREAATTVAVANGFALLSLFKRVHGAVGTDTSVATHRKTTTSDAWNVTSRSKPVPIELEQGPGSLVLIDRWRTHEDIWDDPLTVAGEKVVIRGMHTTIMGLEYTPGPVVNVGSADSVHLDHPKLTIVRGETGAEIDRYMTPRRLGGEALTQLFDKQALFVVYLEAAAAQTGISA